MLSLAKTWTLNGLETWYTRISRILGHAPGLVCEPKVDGVGVELHYRAGVLVLARTRSGHASLCLDSPDLPIMLAEPVDLVVRGEAWTPRTEAGKYSSPRTAAVAALQSWPSLPVRVTVWDVESHRIAGDYLETRRRLAVLGMPVSGAPADGVGCGTIDDAIHWAEEIRRVDGAPEPIRPWSYAIDGAVFKVASTADRQRLGCTATAPRWAMALKWAPG
jgi:DNA ligase (NAD+)